MDTMLNRSIPGSQFSTIRTHSFLFLTMTHVAHFLILM